MFMFFDFDDLRSLAKVIDKYFKNTDHDYEDLVEDVIFEYPDSKDALVDLLVYAVMIPHNLLEQAVNIFLDLPYEEVSRYNKEPKGALQYATSLCPPPEEGPYAWQIILAKWRLELQR